MEHEEVVFILEMAPRTKRTLTRVERQRIKKVNAQWAREAKELLRKGADNEKEVKVKEKTMRGKAVKGVRRGMLPLQEI